MVDLGPMPIIMHGPQARSPGQPRNVVAHKQQATQQGKGAGKRRLRHKMPKCPGALGA